MTDDAAPEEQSPEAPQANTIVPLGERDPRSRRLVLSSKKTLPTARAFLREFYDHNGVRTFHDYAGTPLAWRGNRYVEIEAGYLRHQLQPWLHDALQYNASLELVGFESNSRTISAAVDAVRDHAHLPANVTPPAWLGEDNDCPDLRDLIAFPSGTLNLMTGDVMPPTPLLFNINAIDFEYETTPEPPERWIEFLIQLWGDDMESVQLLQEWMGYCLVGDTSQQKMLLIYGPKRAGKGTIEYVLKRLVGENNFVGPTTTSLSKDFGLQPLIGKSVAVISDARFTGDAVHIVSERLLNISGEDTLTIDRKHTGSVTMKLPTRFMILTNDLPKLTDASGALAGRFMILRLTRSFFGHEDIGLKDALAAELPGILQWAIEGLKRLRQRGRFVQPKSVAEAVQEMEDLASPVISFVRDSCELEPARTSVADLYTAWGLWCHEQGSQPGTTQVFSRNLKSAFPQLKTLQVRVSGGMEDERVRVIEGLRLKFAVAESVSMERNKSKGKASNAG